MNRFFLKLTYALGQDKFRLDKRGGGDKLGSILLMLVVGKKRNYFQKISNLLTSQVSLTFIQNFQALYTFSSKKFKSKKALKRTSFFPQNG